ncbi:asparaginase [Pelosinus fermentans]|uniref:asparaginase n=1 Tax=Pelosinus fermentans JBW45 TaxID=1192197 RepID=I8TX77_9FIRM|nr:asparaginase [Pelosinus fermentans]AJQ26261.1 L-asparaginase, type II [Pelosinus fermentans JBW45]
MKKNIVIIGTGGTIAGKASSAAETLHYTSAILSINSLIQEIPEIHRIAHVTGEQLSQIDSCDMTYDIWLQLAARVNELLASNEVDGIVITHGTDTLEETAYFLNLVVQSQKPVVLVGAMRPVTAMSADGPMNLYNAVTLAANDKSVGKGVLVALNDTVNCSREVTKTNTMLQDSFQAPDLGYLGYIQGGIPYFYRLPARRHTICSEFDCRGITDLPKVEIIYGYVDSSPIIAEAAVKAGAKGIVYAGLGNGNMSHSIREGLINIEKQGVVIVRSTRVSSGIVTRNGAVHDDEYHFVVSDTLSPQKARILLMLALLTTNDPVEIQRMFWEY